MNKILILFIGLLLISCCQDKIVASYRLTASERNIIPFTTFNRLNYIDQNGRRLIGLTQPKTYKIDSHRAGPESCDISEYESMSNFIGFERKDFVFQLAVSKNYDLITFEINKSILDSINSREIFNVDCERAGLYQEDMITNVTLQGFDFENVLIFRDCENNSEINRIIYSAAKGIEFIQYDNENYIKLEN